MTPDCAGHFITNRYDTTTLRIVATYLGFLSVLGFNLAVAVLKQECVIPTAVYSTLTVANPEFILATAVFEYFPSQIAVVEADFAGFDCHQTTEIWKKGSTTKGFCLSYCRFRKIMSWNDSRNRTCCFVYCQFMLIQQSKIQKVDMNCRPDSQPTVHARHFLFSTAAPAVVNPQNKI